MKVTLTNNSCGGLSRPYEGFELDLPGNSVKAFNVPDQHVENLKKYLRQHHPAVVWGGEAPVAVMSAAAVTKEVAVLDINVDDQVQQDSGVTVEQFLRSKGLLSDPAPVTESVPAVTEPVITKAPEAKPAGKKGGSKVRHLKPAVKNPEK